MITLEQGKAYYFEAYHKEIVNTYQLTINWTGPGFVSTILAPPFLVAELDMEKPSVPQNFIVAAKGSEEAIFKWDAATDNNKIKGYVVLLDGYVYLDSIFTSNSAWITGLKKQTGYSVSVMAVDKFLNHSLPSPTISFTTHGDDANPPSAPGNLNVSESSIYSLVLNWDAASDNETEVFGYNIYQDGSSDPVNERPIQSIEYKVRGLQPSTSYAYRVTALDAAKNESDASDQATASTLDFDWQNENEEELIGQVNITLEPVTRSTGFAAEGGFHLSSLLVSNKVSFNSFESPFIKDLASVDDLNKVEKSTSNVSVGVEKTNAFSGGQSLKLTSSVDGYFRNRASIKMATQYTYLVKFAAKKDANYSRNDIILSILKTAGGNVTAHQSTISGLTTEWKEFEIEFQGIENASEEWFVEWKFTAAGNVYFDEVEMHIKDFYDPASKFTTVGIDILKDLDLAGIRWGAIDANYESLSTSVGPYQNNTLTYGDFVHINNQLGGYSMICAGVYDGAYDTNNDGTVDGYTAANATDYFSDKNTFNHLMEYLGGDGSTEWGAKRIAEGYAENLIDGSKAVIIEFGNEVWGAYNHGANTFGTNYPLYAEWSNDVSGNYIKQSPYYDSEKVFTSISGRSPDQSFGINEYIYGNPNDAIDWLGLSGYMGGNLDYEAGVDPGESELDYHKNGYVNFQAKIQGLHDNWVKMLRSTQRVMPVYFYEGNMTTTTYHGSLGQAIAFGDYYATALENGVAIPSVFCIEGGQWRLIDDLPSLRKRPMYYVTRLYNHTAKGGVVLKTEVLSRDILADAMNKPIDLPNLGAHAYADGDKYSIVLFSRSFERDYYAMLNLPDDIGTISNGKMYTLTGNAHNSTTVEQDTADITVGDGMLVKIPVHGMVVISFTADDKSLDAPLGNAIYDKVQSLTLSVEDNKTGIDERKAVLEVYAHLEPEDAFLKEVAWEALNNDPKIVNLSPYSNYVKVKALGEYNGTVTIVATTVDGSGLSKEVTLEITNQLVGIEKEFADLGINIYPNPAKDRLFIDQAFSEARIEIINVQGSLLAQVQLQSGKNELSVEELKPGIYFLRIETPEGAAMKKFIKQ